MRNPAEILGDRLSGPSSRRGFLGTLGKLTLLGGAALAGLGGKEVYAACGAYTCSVNNQYYCPSYSGETDSYAGCCVSGGKYYETRLCRHTYVNSQGQTVTVTDCYYAFATTAGCPNVPAP